VAAMAWSTPSMQAAVCCGRIARLRPSTPGPAPSKSAVSSAPAVGDLDGNGTPEVSSVWALQPLLPAITVA